MMFWLTAAAMVLIALTFVLPPLLRRPRATSPAREAINIDIYRERLAELEADRESGNIDETQYGEARSELEHALLQDAGIGEETPAKATAAPRAVLAGVAIMVPLLAGGFYWKLGSIDVVLNPPQPTAEAGMHSIEQMVSRLAAKLAANPADSEGWSMLGRSYVMLGRYGEGALAFAKARELSPDDPDLLADHAEALALANNNVLAGEPGKLVRQVLARNPNHSKGLWLAGHAAVQQGRTQEGVGYWQRLLAQLPPQSEGAQKIGQLIAQVQGQAPAAPAVGTAAGGVTVKVQLQRDLAKTVAANDTVFVFARAAEGPKMPLAIVRKQVKDLPFTVTLDDSMAMMPELRLSNFAEVVVGARISKSGDAIPKSGDLQGLSGRLSVNNNKPVTITIAERLP